jgi:hypothetical protein
LREKFEEGEGKSLESISAASCVDRSKKKSIEKRREEEEAEEEEFF